MEAPKGTGLGLEMRGSAVIEADLPEIGKEKRVMPGSAQRTCNAG